MKATQLTPGTKITFTPTGEVFELAKVTDKRISWYVGFEFKGGRGINTMKMTWCSINDFQKGIDKGSYVINK
jgi:hypothetical protein